MDEEEYDVFWTTEERIKALGFKPQKEIAINHLLPYAAELDVESTQLFEQIKTNLGKAVMLREMKPGCGVWSARLMKYLKTYGLKFSKEDHIALVKLVYEMILIPDLEPNKVQKFCTLFAMLTKDKYLISPEELTLPWRPIYDLRKKFLDKSRTYVGMCHYMMEYNSIDNEESAIMNMVRKFMSGNGLDAGFNAFKFGTKDKSDLPTSFEASIYMFIKYAKPYFEPSATKEILDVCCPEISPWSPNAQLFIPIAAFLPVTLYPSQAAIGHELWFDKLMDFWNTCANSHCGISELLVLFSTLAKGNPGSVDWSPYVTPMFSRFLHAMNLPVSYKDIHYSKNASLDIKFITLWIVWTISPDGLVLKHLRSFLAGISSYLHSANAGRWSFKIRDFLRKLCDEFIIRVRIERKQDIFKTWENKVPDSYKLREQDITDFVEIVLESTVLAINSRTDISSALHNLAKLRPAIVIPPLLNKLRASLESVTEPHRYTASLVAVSSVARPLLNGPSAGYPEGPTHVIDLLMGALPGLDPNDIKKTLSTLHFILVFSWMVPYIDCSSASEYWSDLTEEEMLTCASTAQFEDFVLIFFERVFNIIESTTQEHARLDTKDANASRSKLENIIESALFAASTSVLMQCSPKIFNEALRKFQQFAFNSNFELTVAGSIVGMVLKVFNHVDPVPTAAAIVPRLCEDLNELLASDEILVDENPPRELLYRLQLLSFAVESNGKAIFKYIPLILPVLDRGFKQHSRDAICRTCDILANIMSSLSVLELTEYKSVKQDYTTAPKDWLPIRNWGKGCKLRDANFEWHIPSKEEVECAQMLLDRYCKPELKRLEMWVKDERPMCSDRRLRGFWILLAATSCPALLPQPDENPIFLLDSLIPATPFTLATGMKHELKLDGENVRIVLTRYLRDVQTKLLENQSDDIKSLELLLQLWERVSGVRPCRSPANVELRRRTYMALERALDDRGGANNTGRLRTLVADAVRLQEEIRFDLQSEAGITKNGLVILRALFELGVNTYTSVRLLAQIRLYWILSHYAYSYKVLVPLLQELINKGGEGDEWHARHKGALYIMLGPKSSPIVAKQDWEIARTLWPLILGAPVSEKQSIMRLEQAFSDTLHRNFPNVNTTLTISDSCIELAKALVPEAELSDPQFIQLFNTAIEREENVSQTNVNMYNELLNELVRIAESPTIIWRRYELVLMMLIHCPNLQTPYIPSVVRFVVNSLVHDNIQVRRIAIRLFHFMIKQRKIKVKKITVDPYALAGVPKPEKQIPGYRPDNAWVMWSGGFPQNDEEWEKPFLRTFDYGFYGWPEKIEVAAPSYEQEFTNRKPEDMEEGERYIYEKFMDDEFVNKLVAFTTVEDKKGKDKFSGNRFNMFRGVMRNFGYPVASKLLKHAIKRAGETQETSQRFACEVASAAVRAPRYWDRKTAMAIYDDVVQVFKIGLASVTPETMEDWGTAVASALDNVDVHRAQPIFQALMEIAFPPVTLDDDADPDQQSSFGVCARLYAFQGALSSLMWRGAPLVAVFLERLESARYIQHPYQSVREVVGSILVTMFDLEVVFPGGSAGPTPRLADFLAKIRPKLAALYDDHGEIVIKSCASTTAGACAPEPSASISTSPEPELLSGGTLVAVAKMAHLSPEVSMTDDVQPQDDSTERPEGKALPLIVGGEKEFAERLQAGLRLSGDAVGSEQKEHARAINLLTTVLRGCMGLIVRSSNGSIKTQYQLMRTACALSARGPLLLYDELARAADSFLAALAISQHNAEEFDTALDALEDVACSRSWWARLACVQFAQPLLFYGLPLICQEPEKAIRAEQFALKLMTDSRLEVRKAASKLLTGLMHCRALVNEDQTIDGLMSSCRSPKIIERHCGVLGLCAYLSSRPYSLGPKIGIVLAELSRHTNAPDPVPSAIRSALADFRRTHQDDWPKHRESLTEEELDLLADLTSPPTYCA